MPHYADGTEAKVGDIVRGTGYNVKHEIIGKVVNVRSGESCTLSVAHVGKKTLVYVLDGDEIESPFATVKVDAEIEYGDTQGFEKIA
jgi:hypothetical protein